MGNKHLRLYLKIHTKNLIEYVINYRTIHTPQWIKCINKFLNLIKHRGKA